MVTDNLNVHDVSRTSEQAMAVSRWRCSRETSSAFGAFSRLCSMNYFDLSSTIDDLLSGKS